MPTVKVVQHQYVPTPGAHISKDDAEVIGLRLQHLAEQHGGSFTADDVVADAVPESAPLHKFFTWDDEEAARLHRLTEARQICRAVRVVVTRGDEKPIVPRAFVMVGYTDGLRYTPIIRALGEETSRAQIIARAWRELQVWKDRYMEYDELARVVAAIEVADKQEVA